MKIVIDARIIASSTGRYVERLLTNLEKIDRVNTYIVLLRTKDQRVWRPSRNNFSIVPADIADFSVGEQIRLLRLLNRLKPDLVHFCMPQQPVLYSGKTVTTIHDMFQLRAENPMKNQVVYKFKQRVGWLVFKRVIASSNHIITDSEYSKRDIERFSSKAVSKTSVVYLAADKLTTEHPSPYPLPSNQYILYVGQQSPHKNIRRLVKAHQELLATHPGLWLVLVGNINAITKRNQRWVEDCGFRNILFTGYVEDTQLAWLYEHARCYGFASLMEGFGLPGLEAMQHGTPLASSNTTCSPEIFGNAAAYFDPTNVDNIAATIKSVLDDDRLRRELVTKGYERLKEFSWEKMARETHAIYRRVLES